jgi:hypothetical protein
MVKVPGIDVGLDIIGGGPDWHGEFNVPPLYEQWPGSGACVTGHDRPPAFAGGIVCVVRAGPGLNLHSQPPHAGCAGEIM